MFTSTTAAAISTDIALDDRFRDSDGDTCIVIDVGARLVAYAWHAIRTDSENAIGAALIEGTIKVVTIGAFKADIARGDLVRSPR